MPKCIEGEKKWQMRLHIIGVYNVQPHLLFLLPSYILRCDLFLCGDVWVSLEDEPFHIVSWNEVTAPRLDLAHIKSPVGQHPPLHDMAGTFNSNINTETEATSAIAKKKPGSKFRLHYHQPSWLSGKASGTLENGRPSFIQSQDLTKLFIRLLYFPLP